MQLGVYMYPGSSGCGECKYNCVCVCTCLCVFVCMHMCMYVCVYVCTYCACVCTRVCNTLCITCSELSQSSNASRQQYRLKKVAIKHMRRTYSKSDAFAATQLAEGFVRGAHHLAPQTMYTIG